MAFKCRKTENNIARAANQSKKNYHEGRIGAQGDIKSQLAS